MVVIEFVGYSGGICTLTFWSYKEFREYCRSSECIDLPWVRVYGKLRG
jgi:hypothetical protein